MTDKARHGAAHFHSLDLALYCFKRVQRVWGISLGILSAVTGAGGLFLLAVFIQGAGFSVWAGVLTPLVIGILDVILWKNRKHEARVV